jgi:hypothetical protein
MLLAAAIMRQRPSRHRASTFGNPWRGKIGSKLTGLSGITAGSTGS